MLVDLDHGRTERTFGSLKLAQEYRDQVLALVSGRVEIHRIEVYLEE